MIDKSDLVEAAKRDPQLFGELYELHYSDVLNYFARRTLDVGLAEDLTSEVFYKALKGLRGFRNRVPFGAWLFRIAANELKMHWRKEKTRRGQERFLRQESEGRRIVSTQPDPSAEEDLRERLNQHAQLLRAMERLPASYREAVTLRYFEGLKYNEIAVVLDRKIGTAKSLVHRGLGKLKGILADPNATFQTPSHPNGEKGGD